MKTAPTAPSLWPFLLFLQCAALAAPAPFQAVGGVATFEYKVTFVTVRGTVQGVQSTVQLDVDDLAATRGSVSVLLGNLKTGIALRDQHAKGENALNTAKYPNVTFDLASVTGGHLSAGQTLSTTVTGNLTLKGVSKMLAVPVKVRLENGLVEVAAQFKFNPREFGVKYPGGADSVSVNVNFTLQPH